MCAPELEFDHRCGHAYILQVLGLAGEGFSGGFVLAQEWGQSVAEDVAGCLVDGAHYIYVYMGGCSVIL